MQQSQKKALIIGDGIAGPALALFLKRTGIEAEIYEARETPDGYSLGLSGNGVAVLRELGLDGAAFATDIVAKTCAAARVGFQQAAHHADRGGFAAAVRP